MGINFYWVSVDGEERHIGKSSLGWVFALHVYPEHGINDLSDWLRYWDSQEGFIKDEYHRRIEVLEMLSCITERESPRQTIPLGYADWTVFHRENHSLNGPNGLCRAKLSSRCIKHGVGTWDCHVGEFC